MIPSPPYIPRFSLDTPLTPHGEGKTLPRVPSAYDAPSTPKETPTNGNSSAGGVWGEGLVGERGAVLSSPPPGAKATQSSAPLR